MGADIDPERSCYGKHRYPTEKDARRVRHKRREASGVELRVYPCYVCGGYHLTSSL
jgi:hypothetical protein